MVNESERQDLGIVLALAYASFVQELRASLERSGHVLHPSFGYVARNLSDGALTLRELADRLGISSPGMLKIVRDMERTKHVERVEDADDARLVRIRLTKRGRSALACARRFHARYERALAKKLGKRAIDAMRGVLKAMVDRNDDPNARSVRPM